MKIKVNLKQLGKKRNIIQEKDFYIKNNPSNVQELLQECVSTCVSAYNSRVDKGEWIKALTTEEIEDMSELGKIAFGINYRGKKQDLQQAVSTAIQAFEDGLFRVFIGERELEQLEERVILQEEDVLTFVRLTMLSGRMW